MIDGAAEMLKLSASSKLNSEWAFLRHLFEIGRDAAGRWLEKSFDGIGERSTVDIQKMFQGFGVLPDPGPPPG